MRQKHAHWLVWLTMLMAAVFSLLPMPELVAYARPAWVPLVVIFWTLALPQYYGLFFAWIAGLIMDVLYGTVFGQNAMAMLFMALAVHQLHRRLRMYPWWQQCFMVLVIVGLYQLAVLWIGNATGRVNPSLLYLLPSVTSALLWPWLAALLHSLRRRFIVI
ncbi:rod shape-determining protein MreD [Sansalvadorimonas verongulae]|uniref:rod shape-determining protein MreD n=1 Tax=Sansalvadorimonas verongulae TaxID=2172824 RepID=UPI0012BD0965|nr:rod shape-determining protein MreD [Sansalvadorimonas verongulae]MTI14825.1 rod shape-determining protein MreD [Sansalvadorimonas verongulae]